MDALAGSGFRSLQVNMSRSFSMTSRSSGQTRKIGRVLGKLLKLGDTVLLEGELGAGKTTLARGIARGLEVPAKIPVTSPTFTLIHEYEGRNLLIAARRSGRRNAPSSSGRLKLFHMDWYRLSSVRGEDEEEILECLSDKEAVCLVEWPERGRELWPSRRLEIFLKHRGLKERHVEIRGIGKHFEDLILSMKKESLPKK